MSLNTLILPLAILGLSGTAVASDLDGETLGTLELTVDAPHADPLGRTTTTQSRSGRGGKSAVRTTSTSAGGKQAQRITYSNGSRSQTVTRGRATSGATVSHYGPGGDRMHRADTTTQYRQQVTHSNGRFTSTQRDGVTVHETRRQGVDGGQHFRDRSVDTVHRSADRMENGRGGELHRSSRTEVNHTAARQGGGPASSHTVVHHSSRPSSRPLAQPGGPSRPTAVRPGGTVVRPSATAVRPNATVVRPGGTVVRPGPAVARPTTVRPARPSAVVVRPNHTVVRPSTVVVRSPRVVTYRTVRPYHGVFVYGPRPVHHVHYVDASPAAPAEVPVNHMPARELDRTHSVAVGLKTGSLIGGYSGGGVYGDLGFGLAGRYRPAESVGLQVDLAHHSPTWSAAAERSQTLAAGSVQLFAFPWTRVSPYAVGGITYDARNIQDEIVRGETTATVIANDALWGLHGGLGVELAMGRSLALDLEGRYIGYLDKSPTDPSLPGALQLTAGLMFHF